MVLDLTKIQEIKPTIDKMGREELIQLNRMVIDCIKKLDREKISNIINKITIGQKVAFEGRYGEIIKINNKTASVFTTEGRTFRVPISLLKIMEE